MSDEFYIPADEHIRFQSRHNRQGGSEEDVPAHIQERVTELFQTGQQQQYSDYEELLDTGLARELARINLPISLYTEMYWQMDLNNLFHFLRLRLDSHAQYEIRAYAEVISHIIEQLCPLAYEAFEEHVLYGCRLSRAERDIVRDLLDEDALKALLAERDTPKSKQREMLAKLGFDS